MHSFSWQGGDSNDLIDEAIDSCPVNCIHYVSHEDLITLEQERLSREDNLDFNNYAAFKRTWTGQDAAIPETSAQYYGSLAMGNRCNNCPSRGCQSCPMFGVGQNPVYLSRLKMRQERKERSGQAKRERDDKSRQEKIDSIYADGEYVVGADPFDDELFDAIFGEGDYAVPSEEPAVARKKAAAAAESTELIPGSAASDAAQALRDAIEDDAEGANLNPYEVLGIKKGANLAEIKRAFRRLAMRWHPDRCANLPELERLQAELIFKQVNLANEVSATPLCH